MKILLVTEKCSSIGSERDGGARLVNTLNRAFGDSLHIMQFGPDADPSANWHFKYPVASNNRFERRVANSLFIARNVKSVESSFTHVIYIHASMQFGQVDIPLCKEIQTWTFPMFLTPSYAASGETVPDSYVEMERISLLSAQNIITPSHLEKNQLIDIYGVPKERIHVIPRGVDTQMIVPKNRSRCGPPKFCSVGSIKPQKNTLGLVRLFADILLKYPDASLKIIGPIQNSDYYESVCSEINRLNLKEHIELTGHVPPQELASALEDVHLHLSASTCETFGRSIFETLASGLPNVARSTGNAAAEYLAHLPYAAFKDKTEETLDAIDHMLDNLPKLSKLALEIGQFYDDEVLSNLLVAKLCQKETVAISDFDGTLFHKNDPAKTQQCIQAFKSYPTRILCSARPIPDLLEKLDTFGLTVNWIVGCSGSIVTDGLGKRLWQTPLDRNEVDHLQACHALFERIEIEGEVLQLAIPVASLPTLTGFRIEVYQGIAFVSHWEASKFRAIHRLLRYINWSGRVAAFGDGPYDIEFLTYYDGTLISQINTFENHIKREGVNV